MKTEYKTLTVKMERLETWSDDGMAAGYLWKIRLRKGQPKRWLHGCCKCGVVGGLDHTVTLSAEGMPTLESSVVCEAPGCDAHYFVRDGKVITA